MKKSLKEKIKEKIKSSNGAVFLRQEFNDFGGYRQVSRVMSDLIKDGVIMKAGYGVYVRTSERSEMFDCPVPDVSLMTTGLEVMKKLGIEADVGKEDRDLRDGKSTQVPAVVIISVGNARIRRKISYGKRVVIYERD